MIHTEICIFSPLGGRGTPDLAARFKTLIPPSSLLRVALLLFHDHDALAREQLLSGLSDPEDVFPEFNEQVLREKDDKLN